LAKVRSFLEHDVVRCPGSVSNPVGTALLGLRVGNRMPFQWDGQECEVLVEHVEHAPAGLWPR
jgi:hypothetical protein